MKISLLTKILDFFTGVTRCPNDGTVIEWDEGWGKFGICEVCQWNPKYPEDKLKETK